jgi:hypothetical protein
VKDEPNTAQVSYTLRPGITPDSELDALAAVYRFILFKSSALKEGSFETAPEDAMKGSKDDRATDIIQR